MSDPWNHTVYSLFRLFSLAEMHLRLLWVFYGLIADFLLWPNNIPLSRWATGCPSLTCRRTSRLLSRFGGCEERCYSVHEQVPMGVCFQLLWVNTKGYNGGYHGRKTFSKKPSSLQVAAPLCISTSDECKFSRSMFSSIQQVSVLDFGCSSWCGSTSLLL